ncbi:hypothetical protein QJS04_geneDACA002217 [Acorus gramineus]|uniref:SOSEKI DIX-like domain-containing protein n=1 Tax=Acorus gramineus TaxID=55184 RepID=A0AAV9A9N4_ACOGR|nr:hypothetical protein QJS04_geneDACA002217 [Acorus gramineus]
MEGRMRKYSQVSPERSKVWTEPPQKYHQQQMHPPQQLQQGKKIPVVYYLCRNRHLEHPHFIEVPLSSPDGLYLRDVIERLNVLRGKGMAAMYSWSCKRSYKNGFVWHDLCEDDLILPCQGDEYVLKGSELLDQSPPGKTETALRSANFPIEAKQPTHQSPPPPLSHEEDLSLSMSPDLAGHWKSRHPSWGGGSSSPSLAEYKLRRPNGTTDASTQTENKPKTEPRPFRETCTRGISTDEVSLDPDRSRVPIPKRSPDTIVVDDEISPPPTSSSGASSLGGKTETLESLIRTDANKRNRFRTLEEEELLCPGEGSVKMKATNVILQLITCGSLSMKDNHSFGPIPAYKPRFFHVKFPSPMMFSSGSARLGELDCLSEKPRLMGLRMEDKEYFSGSLIETKKYRDEGEVFSTLKRSSSYNADRNYKSTESPTDRERCVDSSRSKCLPRTIKISSNRHPKSGSTRSPLSESARNSSAGTDYTAQSASLPTSKASSKRFTEPSGKGSSMRLESFNEEKEKVIKIEESLLRELGLSSNQGHHVMTVKTALVLRKTCDNVVCSLQTTKHPSN